MIESALTCMVRGGGVEPPRRKTLEPKSSASTSSATLAYVKPGRHIAQQVAHYATINDQINEKSCLLHPIAMQHVQNLIKWFSFLLISSGKGEDK